jgi:Iap family predicted aminopeptidase
MDAGYAFSGHYDQFFTGTGEEEATVENLRKATLEEARRSARLAEVAVEGISGLSEVLSSQITELANAIATTQRFAKDSSDSNAELLQHVAKLSPPKRS